MFTIVVICDCYHAISFIDMQILIIYYTLLFDSRYHFYFTLATVVNYFLIF